MGVEGGRHAHSRLPGCLAEVLTGHLDPPSPHPSTVFVAPLLPPLCGLQLQHTTLVLDIVMMSTSVDRSILDVQGPTEVRGQYK